MSRYVFTYDPQDAGDVRDTSTRASVRPRRPVPPDTRESRNPAPEAPDRSNGTVARWEQHATRDERSHSSRAHYVRDRAYLLRESEMHFLSEVGKFRVIAVSDLAKYAYQPDMIVDSVAELPEPDGAGVACASL